MNTCPECGIEIEDGSRFCPNCGKTTDSQADAVKMLTDSANAHRLRGDYESAAADATAALKLDPENAHLAALLSTIYEDQGRYDEAAVWLRTALDIQPRDVAYSARLALLNERIAAATGRRPGRARALDPRLKVVLWASGAFAIIIIVLSFVVFGGGRDRGAKITSPERPSEIVVPERLSPRAGDSGTSTPRTGSAPPIAGGAQGVSTQPRTAAELTILAELGKSDELARLNVTVGDVIADPRQGVATVTYSLPASGALGRQSVIASAGVVARATLAAHPEVKFVTTRCVTGGGAAGPVQIAFVGDIARGSVDALGESATAAQIEPMFTGQWWNPRIK